jgi:N-acetylneuraminic acid mutarotase
MNKIVLHALSILIFSVTHAQGVWTQKADYGGLPRAFGAGFSIGDMGYIGSGANQKDFWEWNSLTDTWTQIADFGGVLRRDATGFSVGNKGYIGTGTSGGWPNYFYYNDLWEWDQSTNSWSKMSDLPAKGRFSSFGFTISNKGYIGTGKDSLGYLLNDFWEFDPANDVWMQKADFGGGGRFFAIGFGVAGKGFAGLGYNGFSKMKDFWMYDTLTNTWAKITDFPGGERTQAVAFSIEDTGYVGLGWNESTPTIFYKNFCLQFLIFQD